MNIDPASLQVIHNTRSHRFEIQTGGHLAVLEYILHGQTITFTHTGVPSALEGQGIGSKLVREGLEYARASGLRVASLCSFVDAYIRRKPEYQEFVK